MEKRKREGWASGCGPSREWAEEYLRTHRHMVPAVVEIVEVDRPPASGGRYWGFVTEDTAWVESSEHGWLWSRLVDGMVNVTVVSFTGGRHTGTERTGTRWAILD